MSADAGDHERLLRRARRVGLRRAHRRDVRSGGGGAGGRAPRRPRRKGRALEFGIGTGWIALPLTGRGVPVVGIDNSEAMARLRAKPGGEAIDVTIGDFATTRVEGEFSVVYLVFNTIFNLVTQEEQVACFQNAAAHLRSGGRFVIETGVPDLQSLPPS